MSLDTLNAVYNAGNVSPIVTLSFKTGSSSIGNFFLGYGADKVLIVEDGEITFKASSFQVALPEKSSSGFTDLNFAISDVDGTVYSYFKQYKTNMLNGNSPTYVTLRQFNPENELLEYELKLSVTGVQFTTSQVNFTASFCDMLNTEFPKTRYTASLFPGLKYVSD